MKLLIAILVISFSQTLQADEMDLEATFANKIYTPQVVVDGGNHGPKGAVQLLWQKSGENTRYELEVSNGDTTYSSVLDRHFHHIMIYFNKDYQWRVREVSAQRTTEYTPWRSLKVVKGKKWTRQSASSDYEGDEYMLDTGAQNP